MRSNQPFAVGIPFEDTPAKEIPSLDRFLRFGRYIYLYNGPSSTVLVLFTMLFSIITGDGENDSKMRITTFGGVLCSS